MRTTLLLFFLSVSTFLIAQKKKDRDTSNLIYQPNRVEFEVGKYDEEFTIINGGNDGLAMVVETYEKTQGKYNWKIIKLDTALNEIWTKPLLVNYTSSLIGYEYYGGKYYVMVSASQYRTQDLIVYEIDEAGGIREFEITTVFPISLEYFEVIGETLILGGDVNSRPVILTYNVNERKPKVLPGFYDNKNEMLDILIDDDEQMFTVILLEKLITKQYSIRAKTFTAEGLLVQDVLVTGDDRKNLIDGASTTFDNGIQLVAGAHSKKSTSYSKGLYLAKFINGRQQFIKYHNYADLENFFGFHSIKKELRIKKRIERRKELGKKNQFNYRLLVHDILDNKEGLNIMVGEAYYPRYSSSADYGGYGSSRRANASFLGFKYTHAIVVAFDNNGEILWDHSFKIKDVLSYSLSKFVSVQAFGDQIVLMYLDENEIRSKIVEADKVVEGQTFNPVRLTNENEQVKSRNPEIEGIDEWYDLSFYAYGLHNLSKPNKSGFRSSRKVFYINKIQYDEEGALN